MSALKSKLADTTNLKSEATETEAKSTASLEVVQKTKADDELFLSDLKQSCQDKAQVFEEESKERADELKALSEAKKILMEGVAASFLQTGLSTRLHTRVRARARSRARARIGLGMGASTESGALMESRSLSAAQYLRSLSRRLGSNALGQVAVRLSQDRFGKVRSMIEAMIEKLLQEAAEESEHKAFCDAELKKTAVAKESKEEKKGKADMRIEKSEADLVTLQANVKKLNQEVSEIDGELAEATKIRQAEKTEYKSSLKDAEQSQQACASAISVLRSYYEGDGSF